MMKSRMVGPCSSASSIVRVWRERWSSICVVGDIHSLVDIVRCGGRGMTGGIIREPWGVFGRMHALLSLFESSSCVR